MDLAVVGLGALGSATLRAAARAGARCVGIDARQPGHDEGSSHGGSRIIRKALHEDVAYVTVVNRAYELWRELEAEWPRRVFDEGTGLLLSGRADCEVIVGTQAVASEHGLPIVRVTREEAVERMPGFLPGEGDELLWDPDGGILRPEEAVEAQVELARSAGAELRLGVRLRSWREEAGRVVLDLGTERIEAERLVLCPGAWAPELLHLPLPLTVVRKVLLWYRPLEDYWDLGRSPTFIFMSGVSGFYGFPSLDERGVKLADHLLGEEVASPEDELPPGEEDRRIDDLRLAFLQGLESAPCERATCLYTRSADGHPVVGAHPERENVFVAAGFSGHGFKHSIALGEALAQLALEGRSELPLGLFDPGRFRSSR